MEIFGNAMTNGGEEREREKVADLYRLCLSDIRRRRSYLHRAFRTAEVHKFGSWARCIDLEGWILNVF